MAIGNSKGLRLSKAVLEQTGITGPVELEVRGREIVVRAARAPRMGWDEAFAKMAAAGDDALLDPAQPTEFDKDDWQW